MIALKGSVSQIEGNVKGGIKGETGQNSEQNVNTIREKETPEQNAGKSFAAAVEGNRARTQTDNGKATGKASDGWVILDDGTKVQYQIKRTTEGTPVVVVEENELFSYNVSDLKSSSKKIKELLWKAFTPPLKVKETLIHKNTEKPRKFIFPGSRSIFDPETYPDKLKSAPNMAEAVKAATGWKYENLGHYPRSDSIISFRRGEVLLQIGQNKYSASVVLGYTLGGKYVFYDMVSMKKKDFVIAENNTNPVKGRDIPKQEDNVIPDIIMKSVLLTRRIRKKKAKEKKQKPIKRTAILQMFSPSPL